MILTRHIDLFFLYLYFIMSRALRYKFKNNSSKWLLMAILLLSFFTFSGIVLKPQARLYVQQTTLVANPQTRFVRSISYKRAALGIYNGCSTRPFFAKSTFNISRMHSHQIRTCINSLEMSYRCRPKTAFFFPTKTFLQDASDYPIISLG